MLVEAYRGRPLVEVASLEEAAGLKVLDAELLADVYLAMTRGQNSLGMDIEVEEVTSGVDLAQVALAEILVVRASADEAAAHEDLLNGLDKAVKGMSAAAQIVSEVAITASPALISRREGKRRAMRSTSIFV
mgnify:CR=1 FL=1